MLMAHLLEKMRKSNPLTDLKKYQKVVYFNLSLFTPIYKKSFLNNKNNRTLKFLERRGRESGELVSLYSLFLF